MILPYSEDLPIANLSAVFKDTTNSYKYFWFLAQLELLKSNDKATIPIDRIIIEMIGDAWFPVIYFKLSFGKQDRLSDSIMDLQRYLGLPKDIPKNELRDILLKKKNDPIVKKTIATLSRYVPYRFLTPWYSEVLRGVIDSKKNDLIISLSNRGFVASDSKCFYKITYDSIEMNLIWKDYLLKHFTILNGFTYWHLLQYLQKNNPNVPNISEKLTPPETRSLNNAKIYWKTYFEIKNRTISCIYSNERIFVDNFSIDHFLPWSFVAHDQLWNLLPVPKSVNSSKGDSLPSSIYIEKFIEIQFDAFHCNHLILKEKALEDYSILFNNSISEISRLNKKAFTRTLLQNIKPLMQIATNMGFSPNWTWISH
jgi:hypothetical protein